MKILDLVVSEIIHKYQNVVVTVLLTPATLLFNPEYIILPVLFIWKLYGKEYMVRYIMSILFGLSTSLFLKHYIRRPRPKVIEGL